jgi:hypothetical protein
MQKESARPMAARFCELSLVLVDSGRYDNGGDNARRDSRQDVVAVDLTPFIAMGWLAEVIVMPVDLLATRPILVLHVVTLLPLVVAHVGVVVVFIGKRKRAAAQSRNQCRHR